MQNHFLGSLINNDATRQQIEAWCRQHTQAIPAGNGDVTLCRVLGKYLLYGLTRDLALTPHLALDGIWEPWVTMAIARHVKPGMRCLDVGACYGYYSVLMADLVGEAGYVEAWEPVHTELTKVNRDLNGFTQMMSVMPFAMGCHDGQATVREPRGQRPFDLMNAGGYEICAWEPTDYPHASQFTRFEKPGGEFDFVKVDVEGAEADVWRALAPVFAMSPKLTACLEFTPGAHMDPGAFLDAIEGSGFQLGTVGHDGWHRPCSREDALAPDTGNFRMLWLTRGAP